ncbi:putative holin-like toxin [Lactobacillus rodentium]
MSVYDCISLMLLFAMFVLAYIDHHDK